MYPAPLSLIGLDKPAHFLAWGFLQISVANLVMILMILALLVAAVLLPFPGSRDRS